MDNLFVNSGLGHPMQQPSSILKMWPKREVVFQATPDEFNVILDQLTNTHCV